MKIRKVRAPACHDHVKRHARFQPGPSREVDAGLKKIVGSIALILLVFYIGTNPGPAADIAQDLGASVAEAFRNIGVFLRNLAT